MAFLGLVPEFEGKSGSTTKLNLTVEEAHREATGRALALMGSVIGVVGSVMILSVNPAMKQKSAGVWSALPESLQRNKTLVIIGTGLGVALLMGYKLQKKNTQRYNT